MIRFKSVLTVVAFAALAVVSTGCGRGTDDDAARMINALSSQGLQGNSVRQMIQGRYQMARSEAEGRAWLARFQSEAGQEITALRPNMAVDPELSCTDSSSGTNSFSITCTNNSADNAFSCNGDSYTWHSGGTFTVSGSMTSNIFSINLSMSGRVSGGEFDAGTNLSCSFGFSLDYTKLQSGSEDSFNADCSNTNFSCTVGSETIGCEDILDAAQDSDNACTG